MVLRSLQVYPGASEQLRLPLGDVVKWNISVRDGYDCALRIKFVPVAKQEKQKSVVSAQLSDGRSVRVKDNGSRIFEEYDRNSSFKGELVLSELAGDGMSFDKNEWDIVFVAENEYSYFTKKVVDMEIVIEGEAGKQDDVNVNEAPRERGLSQYILEQRPDRTPERVFSDSISLPSQSPVSGARRTGGLLRSGTPDSKGRSPLFSEDDPEIQRCLEAKAQVDFVWMRCMLKDALRRCPAEATDLRDLFTQAQTSVEMYIDTQFRGE